MTMSAQSRQPMNQFHAFYQSSRAIAQANLLMLELLYGENPITDRELSRLIDRYPARYGRFAGYLGKRNTDQL
jgi:hypothetical protein